MRTHYDILGIAPNTDAEDIRRAYRRLSKQCHPDVNGGAGWAEEHFKRLNRAYGILADPDLRRAYDLGIVRKNSPSPSSPANPGSKASSRGQTRTKRKPSKSADQASRFSTYFVLFSICLIIFLSKIWLAPEKKAGVSEISFTLFPTQGSLNLKEEQEFLEFYQQYPQLISPSEAQTVFSTPLPEDFTETLKCFLMEGNMAAFRSRLHRPNE